MGSGSQVVLIPGPNKTSTGSRTMQTPISPSSSLKIRMLKSPVDMLSMLLLIFTTMQPEEFSGRLRELRLSVLLDHQLSTPVRSDVNIVKGFGLLSNT